MRKRMIYSVVGGVVLGFFCVIGAYVRSGFEATVISVFSLWFNRVLLGVVIGAPWSGKDPVKSLFRGAVLGFLVSFAFYSSTGFKDHISFLAGIVYGVILEGFLSWRK